MAKWMSVAQVKEKIKESSAEEVTSRYLEVIKKSKIPAGPLQLSGSFFFTFK